MDYAQFTRLLTQANLSGRELARLLTLNENTIANYKRTGMIPSHLAVIVTLIGLLESAGIPYKQAIETLAIQPNRARGKKIEQRGGGKD